MIPGERTDLSDSDAELVARALNGDAAAFGDLYDRYLNPLYRYVYYRVADRHEAEDLTETVFLKAWEALKRMDPDRLNFQAWVYRIAHNTVVDHFRRRKPEVPLEHINNLHHQGPTPEQEAQVKLEEVRLARAISKLNPDQQQVIACRFIAGISHSETAEVMNLREGHVRVLQHRALKRLRELLDE
jgi:RNA polymerase sigma-70 factor (ECF subfamily)